MLKMHVNDIKEAAIDEAQKKTESQTELVQEIKTEQKPERR